MAKETQSESERSSVESMAEDRFQEMLQARTLENTCPLLNGFLKPDMKVLDIGCGPGTITFDLVRQVSRGSVVGIDPNEEALKNAQAAAEKADLGNVEFKVGDTYSLDFPDGSFDLVYSHALFEWLQEPVKAFREQARVTRTGGWVIAMISSWDYIVLYPECPEFRRIMEAVRVLKKVSEDVGFFFNTFAPHEVVSFLVDSAFRNYRIISFTSNIEVAYPGSEYFDYRYHTLKKLTSPTYYPPSIIKYFLANGLIDNDTFEKASAEIENWYHHPHALFIQPSVAACGQVD